MIFDPSIFYSTYIDNFHYIKATYLRKILENLDKYEGEFFDDSYDEEDKQQFRLTLKCELRHTYFHAIESFFEIFFALDPKNKKQINEKNILFELTNANWKKNFNLITKISNGEINLEYLNDLIKTKEYEVSIGHYLFYNGFYSFEKVPEDFNKSFQESLLAIQYGIKILAQDFTNREEYNAYKHGLRIIPAVKSLMFLDALTMEVKVNFDLKDSMSFYLPTKDTNEIKVVTRLFDSERDYLMITFCSNLIHHMIYYRRLAQNLEKDISKKKKVPIPIFGIIPIDECNKSNVEVQDIVYTIKRSESESSDHKFEIKL